jgi:UDP-glucose 4-epimerase
MTVAEIARVVWEVCGEDPAAFALEHLPSFTVDVPRRWPSVAKAQELLGWRARIGVEEGIAATVRWLREREEHALHTPVAVAPEGPAGA